MRMQKVSVANIKAKLNRIEMKNIIANSGDYNTNCDSGCSDPCTIKS